MWAVKMLEIVHPPSTSDSMPRPLVNQGVFQIGDITMRCRMSKSELPQSSVGFR